MKSYAVLGISSGNTKLFSENRIRKNTQVLLITHGQT